jgi:hypothetical protein
VNVRRGRVRGVLRDGVSIDLRLGRRVVS